MTLRPHRKQNIMRRQKISPWVQTLVVVVGRTADNCGASDLMHDGRKTAGLSTEVVRGGGGLSKAMRER